MDLRIEMTQWGGLNQRTLPLLGGLYGSLHRDPMNEDVATISIVVSSVHFRQWPLGQGGENHAMYQFEFY